VVIGENYFVEAAWLAFKKLEEFLRQVRVVAPPARDDLHCNLEVEPGSVGGYAAKKVPKQHGLPPLSEKENVGKIYRARQVEISARKNLT